jgi:hypothetical protein
MYCYRPDLVDFRKVRGQTARENLEMAFSIAEQEFGVTRLLDPEGRFSCGRRFVEFRLKFSQVKRGVFFPLNYIIVVCFICRYLKKFNILCIEKKNKKKKIVVIIYARKKIHLKLIHALYKTKCLN